jgi:ABC-type Fe3+ transport system permease subunit
MLPGLLTPTHVLILLVIVAVTFGLNRLTTPRPHAARRRHRGARPRRLRLRKPTRREAHIGWLLFCLVFAFVVTRAVAMPLFLLAFLAVWACGYGVLARLYR